MLSKPLLSFCHTIKPHMYYSDLSISINQSKDSSAVEIAITIVRWCNGKKVSKQMSSYFRQKSQIFTLYPEDLKWQPRFVKVDFIRMQKALSHVGFPDTRSTLACISDVTGQQTEKSQKKPNLKNTHVPRAPGMQGCNHG